MAEACSPDAVLFTGDAAYAGASDSLRRRMLRHWRRDWGGLWERLYAVPGNHDFDSPRGVELWRDTVPSRTPYPPTRRAAASWCAWGRCWPWAWTPRRE